VESEGETIKLESEYERIKLESEDERIKVESEDEKMEDAGDKQGGHEHIPNVKHEYVFFHGVYVRKHRLRGHSG